jgi:hypothetical protein
MTQAEYNAKVQELQAMWGDASRIGTHYDRKTGEITEAYFQVYWDGHWRTLGRQKQPFQPDSTYEWSEVIEMELRGAFAGALMHS